MRGWHGYYVPVWRRGGGEPRERMTLPYQVPDKFESAGKWDDFEDRLGSGVVAQEVINRWIRPMYVRFFLTDERVICTQNCTKHTLQALSPIYRLLPSTRAHLYYDTVKQLRGWTKPGIRIRLFWAKSPLELDAAGAYLKKTIPMKDYVWRRIDRDNVRIDNRDPALPAIIDGENTYRPQ